MFYKSSSTPNKSKVKDFFQFILYMAVFSLIGYLIYGLFFQRYNDHYDKYYDPKLESLKYRIAEYFPEIKDIEISGSNKSFTINKKSIYICAKDESGKYYDDNMLIYVILHELAHVMCDEVGHTEKYKSIFRGLLERATVVGLYNPATPPLDNYCNY